MAGKKLREAAEKREKRVTCPTKCTPEMIEKIRSVVPNIMGKGGAIIECVHELGVARDTLYQWEKLNDEISDIMRAGRTAREAWWVRKGRENMDNTNFQPSLYKWMTMNTIGWSNRQNVDTNVNVSSTVQEAANKRLKELSGG